MAFLSVVASRFPPSNNQLRTSSNLRNQATIQDGRVTVQQVQGRQNQSYAGTGNRGIATTSKENVAAGPTREKLMLAEAQEAGQILDKEQLAFLADSDDLDAYDSDCDDLSLAKAVLMANLSSCDPEYSLRIEAPRELPKSIENSDLNAQLQEKVFAITALKNELRKLKGKNVVNIAVSKPNATVAPRMFKLDIEPISPSLKNNKDAHEVYIEKTIEYTDTLCGFVESARTQNPSKPLLESACMFTKHVQELLVYVSQTCPSSPKYSGKLVVVTSINKDKRVRFAEPVTSSNNIPKQTDFLKNKYSNKPLLTSTGVKPTTSTSGSKPSCNTKNNRITRPPCSNQKNKVEDHSRKVKSSLNKTNSVSEPISNAFVKYFVRNAKFESMCAICNKCLFDVNHDMCLIYFVNDVNVRSKSKSKRNKMRKAWKSTGKVFTDVGYKWKPTGIFFTIVGSLCPLTRITPKKIVHLKETNSKSFRSSSGIWTPDLQNIYCSQLINFVRKFLGTVRFRNNQIKKIMGYGDYQQGNNLEGVDLLSGSRDINLYIISLDDMLKTSPICLLSKASKTKSWLWHRLLSYLNFGTLNKLAKDGLARGIPKLKFQKDHLCSACALVKTKKVSHQPKAEDTNQEKLYLLHMDLCGPMRVESINQKKYILDEAPDAIIKCIKNIQVRLNAIVRNVRTDNGTEFVNETLRDFYENVSISHQTFVARTPQQNGAVKRQNRMLVEAARTMLIFSKAPLFLWAEGINTACYTPNRSLIRLRYNKTPYELMHNKKPDLSFFHVFGSLCYPTNDNEDLGKLNKKADIGIFIGYVPAKKAFRIYNKRTQKIIETIHMTFDDLTTLAFEQFDSGPGLHVMTSATSISVVATPRAIKIADSRMFTSIDQDAPSSSIPSTQEQEHYPIISQGVEESPKTPLFYDDPLYEPLHEDSTSQGSSSNMRPSHTLFELIGRCPKDHPIENVIGDPSRSVFTRKQLKTNVMWCYFDAFLTS
ncbi:retrovirus-related pol polyprotein from transposon TNT 1-94 [Tanacetum coccineum]